MSDLSPAHAREEAKFASDVQSRTFRAVGAWLSEAEL